MSTTRREFLHAITSTSATCLAAQACGARGSQTRRAIRAVAFDAFPIFDPRAVVARAEAIFPGRGSGLVQAWRARQFEYAWLRVIGGAYVDFWQVTGDALDHAASASELELGEEQRTQLMQAHLELTAWPDVAPALQTLADAGVRLALLSNFTEQMLVTLVERAGLSRRFEHVLSTDRARTFKPDPRAYQLGVDAFGLAREEVAFAAFAGWDAAGAGWFGHPVVWINRMRLPAERLGATPDATGEGLDALVDFVLARR